MSCEVKKRMPFAYIITIVIFVVFQIYKYDLLIYAKITSFGAEVALGVLDIAIYVLYAILAVFSIIYFFLSLKEEKAKAFVPLILCMLTFFFVFVWPTTTSYLVWNYDINRDHRIKTIEMIEEDTISEYRIDMNECIAPFRYSSYTGTIIVQEENNKTKVMFYVYKGLRISCVLIYVSDDSGIDSGDFNFEFSSDEQWFKNISKIDINWYSATVKM